jgi:hypothetical protein
MRLVRSSRRVKKGKEKGKEKVKEKGEGDGGRGRGRILRKDQGLRMWLGSGENQKNLENSGNKMRVNLVSSIAFP